MFLMMSYRTTEAHGFYQKFIHNEERQALLLEHGLKVAGSVHPVNWELFGAILTGDKSKGGYGSDLSQHEIKSATEGSSFEYQYHLHGGLKKLDDDMVVNHIFVSYSPDYKDVEVRMIPGASLKDKFSSWLPGLKKNYEGPKRKQRFRRSIPYGVVKKLGTLVMKISGGVLVTS
jgi:hypothetical protein